jgi:hypothetical protein
MKYLLIGVLVLMSTGCGTGSAVQGSKYKEPGTKKVVPVENPYGDGSGHSAGYNWAQENGGGCNTGKTSFDEGCEEYYRQLNLSNKK